MWQQQYTPVDSSLGLSAIVAALPIFVILFMLSGLRQPAWRSGLAALGTAFCVAIFAYRMPVGLAVSSTLLGSATGLFPIAWVVFSAIFLYRITVDTGKFEIIKDSIGGLTRDQRLQGLLIAFAFGGFLEGAAGFGAPVAVAATMLTGLGFSRFNAAALCLMANTAPVAFGSIGIPTVTLASTTGLSLLTLSAYTGRLCAPVSLILPCYLMLTLAGPRALAGVLPAAILAGVTFAGTQFYMSNYQGPLLVDIVASLLTIVMLVVLFKFWQPKSNFVFPRHDHTQTADVTAAPDVCRHPAGAVAMAWLPYLLLVLMVVLWGFGPFKNALLDPTTRFVEWPGLHNMIQRVPPTVAKTTLYAAKYKIDWLGAAGTAAFISAILSGFILGMSPARLLKTFLDTVQQLALPALTFAAVLGLAFLMNYSGATGTLGLTFAATGRAFPFFSPLLGWMAVFLTGSDTSANAVFGNLQVITANQLHLNRELMASANSAGGVMGKMISLGSIAVATAATGMEAGEESRLFRRVIRHSIILVLCVALLNVFYTYVLKF
jgi:lactate permease